MATERPPPTMTAPREARSLAPAEDQSKALGRPESRYDGNIAQGNSRVQMGHVYNVNNFNGAVYQRSDPATAGPMSTPQASSQESQDAKLRRILLNSLEFEEMNARHMTISEAHAKTCQWLFQRDEYKLWRDPKSFHHHCGFLWLKGKPGAGKSTLMKSALDFGTKSHREDVIISFFFSARGSPLEGSAQGMYRSLIYQLLKQFPSLPAPDGPVGLRDWPLELLKRMFRDTVLRLGTMSITSYVDALDECNDDEALDMIEFFESLSQLATRSQVAFRVLISSRHYPHITIERCLEMILDDQREHMSDIEQYIQSKLHIGDSPCARNIKDDIQQRSSGVFLWVVLVIKILNKDKARGNTRQMKAHLVEIPRDLHTLFDEILRRDSQDDSDKQSLLLTFQWLLYSQRPLTRNELYSALDSSLYEGPIEAWNQEEVSTEDMDRFILHSSRGLAEITKGQQPIVQFIHESVRDYLRDYGLQSLDSWLTNKLPALRHQQLRDCCHRYLCRSASVLLDSPSAGVRANLRSGSATIRMRKRTETTHPFLKYALEGATYHANRAQLMGLLQDEYARSFPHTQWSRLYNLLEDRSDRRLSAHASPAYIFAIMQACGLLEIVSRGVGLRPRWDRSLPDDFYGSLLGVAVNLANVEMLDLLLERGSSVNTLRSEKDHLTVAVRKNSLAVVRRLVKAGCAVATGDGDHRAQTGLLVNAVLARDVDTFQCLMTHQIYTTAWHADFSRALHWASMTNGSINHDKIQQALLAKLDTIEVDWTCNHAKMEPVEAEHLAAALAVACEYGRCGLMKALLERLSDVVLGNEFWDDALQAASANGHEDIVRALLHRGTGASGQYDTWSVPIIRAATNGHCNIVQIMLDQRVDPNTENPAGYTAIHLAAAGGHDEIVSKLLRHGGDPNKKSRRGEDVLQMATKCGHAAVVRVLLAFHREPSTPQDSFANALVLASRHGYDEIVRMLLNDTAAGLYDADHIANALRVASEEGHAKAVEALLPYTAGLSQRQLEDAEAVAIKRGHRDITHMVQIQALWPGRPKHLRDQTPLGRMAARAQLSLPLRKTEPWRGFGS